MLYSPVVLAACSTPHKYQPIHTPAAPASPQERKEMYEKLADKHGFPTATMLMVRAGRPDGVSLEGLKAMITRLDNKRVLRQTIRQQRLKRTVPSSSSDGSSSSGEETSSNAGSDSSSLDSREAPCSVRDRRSAKKAQKPTSSKHKQHPKHQQQPKAAAGKGASKGGKGDKQSSHKSKGSKAKGGKGKKARH